MLMLWAPWLPPMIKTENGFSPLPVVFVSSAALSISCRIGLPVTITRCALKYCSVCSNDTNMQAENRDSIRLVTPGSTFCSCSTRFILNSHAPITTGPAEYPPTPTTRCGLNFKRIQRDSSIPLGNLKIENSFRHQLRPFIPSADILRWRNPFSDNIDFSKTRSVPTNITSTSGALEINSCATAMPGKR